MSGVERQESEPGDAARRAANVVLFVPRVATELFFIATGTAIGLIDEEQIVPRVDDMLNPGDGEVHIFPTAFAETGAGVNVGARIIGRVDNVATTVRFGFGGTHDLVAESRLRLAFREPLPFALSLEALHDERSSIGFLGLGQEPEKDTRNAYRSTAPSHGASYGEQRERFIAGTGVRPANDSELFISTSFTRRRLMNPADGSDSLADVFEDGSVPGAYGLVQTVYSELAFRLDTRRSRAGPEPGFLFETYAGRGDGLGESKHNFVRAGGRVAGFFPILSRGNVLSPKLVLDGLSVTEGPVPFVELPRQSDFRGFDNRRDYVSAVASLDYRWAIARYVAARAFGDVATVAPRVNALSLEALRYDAGFGFDIYSRSSSLGSLAVSGSPDGMRFILYFGVASSFGDRQHRS
ncbi:MAG: hypothetical protein IPI67_10255 [Myxococcales bacterium]|nr:hypothetical protein [Myxococcales bacterium]